MVGYTALQRYGIMTLGLLCLIGIWWMTSARSLYKRMRVVQQEVAVHMSRACSHEKCDDLDPISTQALARAGVNSLVESTLAHALRIESIESAPIISKENQVHIVPIEMHCSANFFRVIDWYNAIQKLSNVIFTKCSFQVSKNNNDTIDFHCSVRVCLTVPCAT